MSLYLSISGRRISVEFPSDLAAWPELRKVVENARRLDRELQEAGEAHLAAQAALNTAIADDRARLAEAKVKGQKKLPTANDVGAAKAALEETERQRSAAEDARRMATHGDLDGRIGPDAAGGGRS